MSCMVSMSSCVKLVDISMLQIWDHEYDVVTFKCRLIPLPKKSIFPCRSKRDLNIHRNHATHKEHSNPDFTRNLLYYWNIPINEMIADLRYVVMFCYLFQNVKIQLDYLLLQFISNEALKDGMKESTMIVSGDVTLLGDQLFTCRISVGDEDQYDDTLVPLKTFTVRYV